MSDLIIIGGFLFGTGVATYGLLPHINTLRDEVRFARFKRQVRALWAAHVQPGEDIIAKTGDDPWFYAFSMGQTPEEAVFD